MTTPYCSKDQWAVRKSSKTKSFSQWTDFATEESYPDANSLEEALEDATNIINDHEHIGCLSTNISDTEYTERLERICYNMANRILGVEIKSGFEGGSYRWSPQDFLYQRERDFLVNLGILKKYRVVGGFG